MTNRSDRQRVLFGVHVTAQAVALVVAAMSFAVVVAVMVLAWLERTA